MPWDASNGAEVDEVGSLTANPDLPEEDCCCGG